MGSVGMFPKYNRFAGVIVFKGNFMATKKGIRFYCAITS